MVVLLNLFDNIECLAETASFTLPAFKPNSFVIEFGNSKVTQPVYQGIEPPLPFAASKVFNAIIRHKRRLTGLGDCKAVYEVTFDVEGSTFNFKAGDTIGVIPHNNESEVGYVVSHLNLTSKANLCYSITVDTNVKGGKIPVHIPVKSTIRHVLTYCVDLRSIVKKLFLLALAKYTKDERERRVLEYLCSKEGSAAYTTHILNLGLCVLDIFTTFTSCKPPIEVLLANLPRLLPRPYSIVNSGLKNNKILTICFSVMTVNNRKGLTTGWLENIILNSEQTLENQLKKLTIKDNEKVIQIYLRKNLNGFSLPENVKKPLILIGPGTGVAPFIGFLEEREFVKGKIPEINLGESWLFFGCRDPKLDFIYEDELNGFISRGILNKLSTSFSRMENTEFKYIQDSLAKNMQEIITLINEDAIVYVCGDLKTMVAQVKELFVNGFIDHVDMTPDEATAKILEMQKDKRLIVDAWI